MLSFGTSKNRFNHLSYTSIKAEGAPFSLDCTFLLTMTNNRHGLILEGGAMRGLFTAGVIDVMMEAGIEFDCLVGVSAGSSFGCNYKSRQPGRVLRYNLRFCKDSRYMGLSTLLRTGDLVGGEFAYHTMPLELDVFDSATFESNPMDFYSVCTDVATGAPVYYKMDKVTYESLEWLRASASMPGVTRPVKVDDGRYMLDGGISDSIPLEFAHKIGLKRNVVILTQPRDYVKQPAPRTLLKLFLKRYPAIMHAMEHRHEMYNAQLEYLRRHVESGDTLVIAPSAPLPIGRVSSNRARMRHVYQLGRQAALDNIEKVKQFLSI